MRIRGNVRKIRFSPQRQTETQSFWRLLRRTLTFTKPDEGFNKAIEDFKVLTIRIVHGTFQVNPQQGAVPRIRTGISSMIL